MTSTAAIGVGLLALACGPHADDEPPPPGELVYEDSLERLHRLDTHGALVYIDGFAPSPFACSYECCHEDLRRAAIVYHVILNNFIGLMPPYDGEPYAAIEPDQPCE